MTTKLLLEFAFVIFLLQVSSFKSYLTPIYIVQQKYDEGIERLEKFIDIKLLNKLNIVFLVVIYSIYGIFYLISYDTYNKHGLMVFPIVMIILNVYNFIRSMFILESGRLSRNIVDKIAHLLTSVYVVYFVYLLLR